MSTDLSVEYKLRNLWNCPVGRLEPFLGKWHFNEMKARSYPNSRLVPDNGLAFRRPLRIVPESTPFGRKLSLRAKLQIVRMGARRASKVVEQPLVSLINFRGWHQNYFHWLVDCLPILSHAESRLKEESGKIQILLPKKLLDFQRASLELLGYGPDTWVKVAETNREGGILAKRFYACHAHRWKALRNLPVDAIHPGAIRWLRERTLAKITLPEEKSRLLILRGGETERQFGNEEVVRRFAREHDFRMVRLEEFSFEDQAKLFATASHVIAAHGSGLANLAFAGGCKVLEIHSIAHGIRPEYFQIATINNCAYRFFVTQRGDRRKIIFPEVVAEEFLAEFGDH